MNIIKQIKGLVEANGTVFFNEHLNMQNNNIIGIRPSGEVIGEEDDYMLEELTEDELYELLIHLEDQIESDEKLMEKCKSHNW